MLPRGCLFPSASISIIRAVQIVSYSRLAFILYASLPFHYCPFSPSKDLWWISLTFLLAMPVWIFLAISGLVTDSLSSQVKILLFHPLILSFCLSVCLSVCVSVRVFHYKAILDFDSLYYVFYC